MRSRSHAVDHDAAVARRLELLTSELAAVRDDSAERADSWVPHGHTRIRAVPDPDPEPETSEVEPRPVPPVARMPGRHASRRTVAAPSGWVGLVPDPLRGGWASARASWPWSPSWPWWGWSRPAGSWSAAAATRWVPRSRSSTPAQPLARPQGSRPPPVDTAADGGGAVGVRPRRWWSTSPARYADQASRCCARAPGWSTRSGRRVARGPGSTSASLNLAQVLTDGEQIVVGGPVAPPTGVAAAASGATGAATLVDLNTADQTALESLPEVGPVTAQAIIAWRTEHGGFSAVSQLLDVDGIGDATLAKLTPYVTL